MTTFSHQEITFFAICLLSLSQLINAQFLYQFCYENFGTYSLASDYGANVDSAITQLASLASTSYYNNVSVGTGTDKANAYFSCRYDISSDACQSCVQSTLENVPLCFRSVESMQVYQECTLHYSNFTIFALKEESPSYYIRGLRTIKDDGEFKQLLSKTFKTLISDVLTEFSISSRFFATKTADYSVSETLYTLGQCNEDLTPSDCNDCLQHGFGNFTLEYPGAFLGQLFMPSCRLSYKLSSVTMTSPYDFSIPIVDTDAPAPEGDSPAPSSSDGYAPPPPNNSDEDLTPPTSFPDEEVIPSPPSTRFFNNGRAPLGSTGTIGKSTSVSILSTVLLCVWLLL